MRKFSCGAVHSRWSARVPYYRFYTIFNRFDSFFFCLKFVAIWGAVKWTICAFKRVSAVVIVHSVVQCYMNHSEMIAHNVCVCECVRRIHNLKSIWMNENRFGNQFHCIALKHLILYNCSVSTLCLCVWLSRMNDWLLEIERLTWRKIV